MNEGNGGFNALLQRHRGGGLLDELDTAMARVVKAVRETGQKGAITLKLDVAQAARGQAGIVIEDQVKTKEPSLKSEVSFWFAGDDGRLLVKDPRQAEFPLDVLAGGKAPERASAAVNS